MASGNDARLGIARETVYGTRVAPTRFFHFTGENFGFQPNRAFSSSLGLGRWTRTSKIVSKGGSGSLSGEVPTVGFGYLLDGLNSNPNTPVQIASTTAYTTTITLDTPVTKSFSGQIQTPPVGSSTLLPQDLTGITMGGLNLSWDPDGFLTYEIPTTVRNLQTDQSLATYVAPGAWEPFSYLEGSLTIGGSAVAGIIGGGTLSIAMNMRTDAIEFGSSGLIAKPVETDKPTASGEVTADFNDFTHLQRMLDNTVADVVLKFEGAIIAATNRYTFQVTIPDCVFTSPRPAVGGPGPVQQTIGFESASSTGDPVVITIISTGATL